MKDAAEKPEISGPLPLIVRGRHPDGNRFWMETKVKSMNRDILRFPATCRVEPGTPLFFLIRFPATSAAGPSGPRVAARGAALTFATVDEREWTVTARLSRYRFL